MVEIFYESSDPRHAAEVINTYVEEYAKQDEEARQASAQEIGSWLEQELKQLKRNLTQSEQRLQQHAQANRLVYAGEGENVEQTRLRQLQDELSRAQADRRAKQSRYERAATSAPDALPEVLDNATLRELQSRLTELRRQAAELSPAYKPAHYKVQSLQAQITELEGQIRAERSQVLTRIRNEYQAALRREELLERAYAGQTAQVTGQAAKALEHGTLLREAETHRQVWESMLQKATAANLASAMRTSNIRVIDPAKPPVKPYKPRPLVLAVFGVLAGSFLGVGLVVLRARSGAPAAAAGSIRSPGFSPQVLRLPELGVIPSGGGPGAPPTLLAGPQVELATSHRRPSLVAESFRAAVTSILFSNRAGRPLQVLAVTSPEPGEGKTTSVCNLGIALAEIQGRVLLIDGDMRKPRLHRVFGVANTWGLNGLLRENRPIEDYPLEALAVETGVPGLYLLPSGPETSRTAGLLFSERLRLLLQRCRREFETVLIDTPPILPVPDARVMARLADGAILVLRAGKTTVDTAMAARERLGRDGAPVLGTLLNDWEPAGPGHPAAGEYYKYFYGAEETNRL
jgi:capsular exopolysaccharide synthesis family protein